MRRGSPKTADDRRTTLVKRMRDVAEGDRAALQDVYDMTSAKLFGICLRILQDRPEAEDVLQDVFVTVWSRASDFDASQSDHLAVDDRPQPRHRSPAPDRAPGRGRLGRCAGDGE